MNLLLIDILTETSLRTTQGLQAAAIEQTSAGTPWLDEAN